VLDLVNKLEAIKTDQEAKEAHYKQVCQELKEAKAAHLEQSRAVQELIAETDPLRVCYFKIGFLNDTYF